MMVDFALNSRSFQVHTSIRVSLGFALSPNQILLNSGNQRCIVYEGSNTISRRINSISYDSLSRALRINYKQTSILVPETSTLSYRLSCWGIKSPDGGSSGPFSVSWVDDLADTIIQSLSVTATSLLPPNTLTTLSLTKQLNAPGCDAWYTFAFTP